MGLEGQGAQGSSSSVLPSEGGQSTHSGDYVLRALEKELMWGEAFPTPRSPLILLLLQTPISIQRTRLPTPLVFHHVLEEMREEDSAHPQLITCLSVQRVKVVNGETELGKNRELEMTDRDN